jgi:hypothetical protein
MGCSEWYRSLPWNMTIPMKFWLIGLCQETQLALLSWYLDLVDQFYGTENGIKLI